jgi:xanthine phosphoribosyltransferase
MSESEKFIRRVTVSWEELDVQSRRLAASVKGLKPWRGIIAVARGGLVPAAIVAYELDVRMVDTLCISTYDRQHQREAEIVKAIAGDGENMLVVEDIVDTGVTGKIIREMLPKCYFAAIFAKPKGSEYADKTMIDVAQDTWIDFPWDMPADLAAKVSG